MIRKPFYHLIQIGSRFMGTFEVLAIIAICLAGVTLLFLFTRKKGNDAVWSALEKRVEEQSLLIKSVETALTHIAYHPDKSSLN